MNNVRSILRWAPWVFAVLVTMDAAHAEGSSKNGYRLARDAGCTVCHDVEPPAPSDQSLLPLAPSFESIARRYGKDAQAAENLAAIVRDGTGPLRRDRHWDRKAMFDRMYPNEIPEEEAREIVDWILTLAPAPPKEPDRRAQRR